MSVKHKSRTSHRSPKRKNRTQKLNTALEPEIPYSKEDYNSNNEDYKDNNNIPFS